MGIKLVQICKYYSILENSEIQWNNLGDSLGITFFAYGLYYPVCGMVHVKDPLPLVKKKWSQLFFCLAIYILSTINQNGLQK